MKTNTRTSKFAVAAATVVAGLSLLSALSAGTARSCPNCKSGFAPGTYTGEVKRVGNGVAYSWVTLNEKGKPSAIGVTLTETALDGLNRAAPKTVAEMARDMYALTLPREAKKTAFDHLSLDWNPVGHEPLGIYDKPHFDLHFYMITPEAREKIKAVGADVAVCRKPVPADYSPAGYVYATGTEVPMMGGHWINPQAPELNGQPFTQTFLFGSYNSQMIFLEPMITRAFLEEKTEYSAQIATPKSYTKSAYYPTRYSIRYDADRHEHVITLDNMVWQEAKTADKAKTIAAPAKDTAVKSAPLKTARRK